MSADLQHQLQSALGTAFTIERELGGSGMSRVFVANDNALARRVVVKLLPPKWPPRSMYAARPPDDDRDHYEICSLAADGLLEQLRRTPPGPTLARLDSLLNQGYERAQFGNLVAARLFEARGDLAWRSPPCGVGRTTAEMGRSR